MRSLKALWTMIKLAVCLGILAGIFIVVTLLSVFGGFILCGVIALVLIYAGIKADTGPSRPRKYYRQ